MIKEWGVPLGVGQGGTQRSGEMAQLSVKCMPYKHEDLSLVTNTSG